jgi:uncharacterized cupin superfamily protein
MAQRPSTEEPSRSNRYAPKAFSLHHSVTFKARTVRIEPAFGIRIPFLLEVDNRLEDAFKESEGKRLGCGHRSTDIPDQKFDQFLPTIPTDNLMKAFPIVLLLASLSSVPALAAAPNPVKITAAQAAGPIFDTKEAQRETDAGHTATDVPILHSTDKTFTAGLYKAGASDEPIESYPEDEFCYFLRGSVTLTSSDGTVVKVKAGEAVAIHKGWKGRWTTKGYTKYYVVYDPK